MKHLITAGLLYRREVRRFLLSQDVKFTEDKGFLDSAFYVNCGEQTFNNLVEILQKWHREVIKDN
jgi:hypothetical protein